MGEVGARQNENGRPRSLAMTRRRSRARDGVGGPAGWRPGTPQEKAPASGVRWLCCRSVAPILGGPPLGQGPASPPPARFGRVRLGGEVDDPLEAPVLNRFLMDASDPPAQGHQPQALREVLGGQKTPRRIAVPSIRRPEPLVPNEIPRRS